MSNSKRVIDYENANGFLITLKVEKRIHSPISQRFIISYKSKELRSSWFLYSLIFAFFFNIITLSYIRISLTATFIIVIVLSFLMFFWLTHTVQSETLLVIPTVGMQSSVKYVIGREDNYVSWNDIDDVIIYEVIKFNRIMYYLMIIVKIGDSEKLIPVFQYTKPRLMMLQVIYAEVQSFFMDSMRHTKDT